MPSPFDKLRAPAAMASPAVLERSNFISTGVKVLDQLITGSKDSCPGYPQGRLIQMYGEPRSGKTTLALKASAEVAKFGGLTLWVDFSGDFPPDYAQQLGVPTDDPLRFAFYQPETIEDAMRLVHQALRDGVDLLVLDGVDQGASEALADREHPAANAAAWTQLIPQVTPLLRDRNVCCMVLQGVRAAFPRQGIQQRPQPRGTMWKFYSSLRIALKRMPDERYAAFIQKSTVSDASAQQAIFSIVSPTRIP